MIIKFNAGNQLTVDGSKYPTMGHILGDDNLKAVLGYGCNVEGTVDGVTLASDDSLSEDDTVTLVTKANEKA